MHTAPGEVNDYWSMVTHRGLAKENTPLKLRVASLSRHDRRERKNQLNLVTTWLGNEINREIY
jgi:hypothetical protein